jgi:cytosine/adenosine deaminase-related metal-dependent hydrolase
MHHQHDSCGRAAGGCLVCAAIAGDESTRPQPNRRGVIAGALGAAGALAAPARAQTGARPPEGTFVVAAGAALVERDGALVVDHDVNILVRDGVIADVTTKSISGFPVLDARGDLVLPGYISGHTHVSGGITSRGLFEHVRSYRPALQLVERLSDEDLDAVTAHNLAEILRSGCTTQVEMSVSQRQAESYVRIAKKWNVRGFPGGMIPNTVRLFNGLWPRASDQALLDSEPETLKEIAQGIAFAKKHMNANDGLIIPMMAIHATDTHTDKTMRALKAACVEIGTGLHLHHSQSQTEADLVRAMWKMNPTQWLDSFGLLDQIVFGAHMSGIDWAAEGPLMKAKGEVYSHCPSGGGAGGGSQPYPEALAAGVAVNIGIDTHSNDYVEDMKLAVLYGRNRARALARTSPVPLKSPTIWDALDGATRIPARGLKRLDLGRLAVGAQADIATIDVSGLIAGSGAVGPEPVNNLLYCNGRMVRHVMTKGRIQVFDGTLVVDDEAKVIAAGAAVMKKLWAQLEKDGFFAPARAG